MHDLVSPIRDPDTSRQTKGKDSQNAGRTTMSAIACPMTCMNDGRPGSDMDPRIETRSRYFLHQQDA